MRNCKRKNGVSLMIVAAMFFIAPLANATNHHISITNFQFVPHGISIDVGDTVTWTNNDAVLHTSTSDQGVWNSGNLAQGASFSFAFVNSGRFPYHCAVHVFMKDTISVGQTGINDNSGSIPSQFALGQNYPNPFNAETNIDFTLSAEGHALLEIYNVLGQRIDILVNQTMGPGTYKYNWNAGNRTSGVFFYRLTFEGHTRTGRMTLLK